MNARVPALIAVSVTLAAAALAPPAFAATPEQKCQDGIAVAAQNYFKTRYKVIRKCEDAQLAGDPVSCGPTDPGVVDDLTEAKNKLQSKIQGKCDDQGVNLATLPLGDPCDGLASAAALATCIVDDAHGDSADRLLTSVYDANPIMSNVTCTGSGAPYPCCTGSGTGTCDIADADCTGAGTPYPCCTGSGTGTCEESINDDTCTDAGEPYPCCTGAGAGTCDELRLCRKAVGNAAGKLAQKRTKTRRKCAKKVVFGTLVGPCPDLKTQAALDKAAQKFVDKTIQKCTDAQVLDVTLDSGIPCEAFHVTYFDRMGFSNELPANLRLARCLSTMASERGDAGAETVFPLPDAAPFSYGIAAGDATPTAFIAWTRTDGAGTVTLEVATDPAFLSIVHTNASLTPDAGGDNTVKADVTTGLSADTQYYYRFTQGGDTSRTGSIRTAPLTSSTASVLFAFSGDSNAFFKPYTVLDGLRDDAPDLWLFFGDTIYGDDTRSGTGVATTLADYHTKYKENRDDRAMRDVFAAIGMVNVWDDHEVTNDFWGTDGTIAAQMAAGNSAFRDYMPMREDTGDPTQLYRSFRWGPVEFFVTDDRQYRSSQAYVTEPACLDTMGDPVLLPSGACTTEINNPARTYLGATQKAWLKAGLLASTATWKFVMNGPVISALLFLPYDRWEGYAAERTEMLEFIRNPDGNTGTDDHIKNVIFLSTDIHAAIVNDAVANPGPAGGSIRELVAGAIGMDPIYRELPAGVLAVVSALPAIFPTVSYFDIDRFNYALIEASTTAATLTYRDVSGQTLNLPISIAAEP